MSQTTDHWSASATLALNVAGAPEAATMAERAAQLGNQGPGRVALRVVFELLDDARLQAVSRARELEAERREIVLALVAAHAPEAPTLAERVTALGKNLAAALDAADSRDALACESLAATLGLALAVDDLASQSDSVVATGFERAARERDEALRRAEVADRMRDAAVARAERAEADNASARAEVPVHLMGNESRALVEGVRALRDAWEGGSRGAAEGVAMVAAVRAALPRDFRPEFNSDVPRYVAGMSHRLASLEKQAAAADARAQDAEKAARKAVAEAAAEIEERVAATTLGRRAQAAEKAAAEAQKRATAAEKQMRAAQETAAHAAKRATAAETALLDAKSDAADRYQRAIYAESAEREAKKMAAKAKRECARLRKKLDANSSALPVTSKVVKKGSA